MNDVWESRQAMLTSGQVPDMAALRSQQQQQQPPMTQNANVTGPRSQDDATVGYFYQRQKNDSELSNYTTKRWAVGDDSVLEQSPRPVDIERDFSALSIGHDLGPGGGTKKTLWDVEDNAPKGPGGDAASKTLFHPHQQHHPTHPHQGGSPWTGGGAGHPRENNWDPPAEHVISQPIHVVHRRPGSFPGNDPSSVLSPRSETGALGVNMVEYVLGGSPTGKELDHRLARMGVKPFVPQHEQNMIVEAQMDKKSKTPSPFESGDVDRSVELDHRDVTGQANGIVQNGLDENAAAAAAAAGFRYQMQQPGRPISPSNEDKMLQQQQHFHMAQMEAGLQKMQQFSKHDGGGSAGFFEQQPHLNSGLQIDAPQFEPVGIDPVQFDYSSQLMPSMDSPNFNMEYTQQLIHQRQQQQQQQQQQQPPIAVLTQQQYAMAAQQQQQLGLPPTAPYVINAQDPYNTVGIPITGPAMIHPQYYGVQTPWGVYPASLIQQQGQQNQAAAAAGPGGMNQQQQQQQQQQLLRGQNGRPLTPSQQNDGLGTPTNTMSSQPLPAPGAAGYQILAPAYYDQNGQLVMGNPRGMGTPVRLVSPAPMLVSATGNQQGGASNLPSNPLRLLTTQAQQVQTPPVVYSGSNSTTPQSNNMGHSGYTPPSSLGFTPANSSLFTPSNSLGLNPQMQSNPFGSGSLNNLASSASGSIGSDKFITGLSGQRRESLEFKQRQMTPLNQYYNSLGLGGSPAGPMGLVQPTQSLTPPPSLTGSNPNLTLGFGGTGRYCSAAPGAEAKMRNGPMSTANGFFGTNTLFPTRNIARSASLSKEVTGRSRLLEDFRNNRIPNLQLKNLVNHVVEFSQDQHGSRFIQQKLERATPAEKAMVFSEILAAAYSLMTDVFGNYVIQKFFEFGSSDQKQTLAQRVRGHVLQLALQMYGCRVIQKALESIPPDMQVEIVKELDGHVLKCVKDQNGNHVVQKCIECVEPQQLQFAIDAFKGQVYTLSTHPYGCRVIQRILEHCNNEQTAPILAELHEHIDRLVQDQYGNYVVQHVLEHGCPEDKSKIINTIRGKVLVLAQHKFASNVVEKCVSHSCPTERAMLIDEVCSMNDGPQSALYTMMKDQFANYVVQKMIDVAEPSQRKVLMHKIRPHIGTLRKYTYGKHILTKLEKFLMKNSPGDLGPIGMPPNGMNGMNGAMQ